MGTQVDTLTLEALLELHEAGASPTWLRALAMSAGAPQGLSGFMPAFPPEKNQRPVSVVVVPSPHGTIHQRGGVVLAPSNKV